MNYSECMKKNPGGLAVAIQEWWHALAGDQGHISASRGSRSSSPHAATLAPITGVVVQRSLGCLLVIGGVTALALRLAEIVNSPWLVVNTVLKFANWF